MAECDRYVNIRITPELLETLFTRDDRGNRLKIDLGDPDEDGFHTVTVTTDYEDNIMRRAVVLQRGDTIVIEPNPGTHSVEALKRTRDEFSERGIDAVILVGMHVVRVDDL